MCLCLAPKNFPTYRIRKSCTKILWTSSFSSDLSVLMKACGAETICQILQISLSLQLLIYWLNPLNTEVNTPFDTIHLVKISFKLKQIARENVLIKMCSIMMQINTKSRVNSVKIMFFDRFLFRFLSIFSKVWFVYGYFFLIDSLPLYSAHDK